MKKVGKYEIPSVRACFAMLESLSHHPGGVLLSEIVEAGVLPLASAFRMSVVLENLGYVARDPETKRIRLTDKLLLLGQRALTERGLLEQSQGVLRALRDKVDGTVLIGVRDGASFVVLDQVIGSRMFCFVSKPGYRLELHCSAPGKAVWAFLPEDEREALFRQVRLTRYNVRTRATAAAVRADLAATRERGYAVDDAEQFDGVYCVGAPVLDKAGYPIAAIWTTGLKTDIKPSQISAIGKAVRAAAGKLSGLMGFQAV